jgi:hypothetical protein
VVVVRLARQAITVLPEQPTQAAAAAVAHNHKLVVQVDLEL